MTSRTILLKEMAAMLNAHFPASAIRKYDRWLDGARKQDSIAGNASVEMAAEEIERFRTLMADGERESRLKSANRILYLQFVVAVEADLLQYSATQASKGKAGAAVRWSGDDRATLTETIKMLANEKDELGDPLPPSELWSTFFSMLEEAGFDPADEGDRIVLATGDDCTFDTFRRAVQRYRKDHDK